MPAIKLDPTTLVFPGVSAVVSALLSRGERATAWLPTTGVLEALGG
jgi:hypothetical protein